jgi:DNA polymerase-1
MVELAKAIDPTALLEPDTEDVLYVLDLHCWLHRYYATTGGAAPYGFIEMVGKILRNKRPHYAAVCTDLPHPTFRHSLAPGVYKANRAKHEPDPTLMERLRWAREMVQDVFGLKLFAKRGFEADDLMATLVRHALADGLRVVLVAMDKDMMQLVDGHRVIMWDPLKDRIIGPDHCEHRFGIRNDQLRDYLAIVGDTSDSIPGISGMGPKAAVEILKEFGSLDEALAVATSAYGHPFFVRKPRYRAMLREQRDVARLAQKLVTLEDNAPIDFDLEELRTHP